MSELLKRWKLATKKEIEEGIGLIKIKDREGHWIEQSEMLSKYLRRLKEIEMISASQFAKMYTTSSFKLEGRNSDCEDDGYDFECDVDASEKTLTDYIITGEESQIKLPKHIILMDPMPRESKVMRKRNTPAVLRYHKGNKFQQFESWMLKELMLYTPFRKHDWEEYENKTAEMYLSKKQWIQNVKSKVMEHLESVREARLLVEELLKETNLEDIGNEINAAFEQDQVDVPLKVCQNVQITFTWIQME